MATSTTTPNMNLTVPTVGQETGPQWAADINASLGIIDAHDHTLGNGVPITPDGINISKDLPFNDNDATSVRSVRMQPQGTPITAAAPDLGCVYVSGADLYFNDGAGNQIRITQSGSVAGATGTITGLPSGTASAAYSAASGSFIFQQATSTGANLDVSSVAIRYPGSYPTPTGNYIQIQAPTALASGFALTLPTSTAASSGSLIASDTSGNLSYAVPDNTTIENSAGSLRVKALGINTAQITDLAVTTGKINDGAVTQVKRAALGQQVSSSCGTFTWSDNTTHGVTNLSVTITTTGRPVCVGLIPEGGAGVLSYWGSVTTTTIILTALLLRGATEIGRSYMQVNPPNTNPFFVPMLLSTIDVIGAGTYTYSVQANQQDAGVTSNTISNYKLIAYEL